MVYIDTQPNTCLVLGGRGFIGSHLINALLQRGYLVRCFDRPNVISLNEDLLHAPGFSFIEGDLTNEAEIAGALEGCDVCYHLISTTLPKSSNDNPAYDIESNVVATIKVLNNCIKHGIKKFIFVSSGGTVYGTPLQIPIDERHPTDPYCSYGIAKLAIEKYLELYRILHGLDYTILRIANPFGERQRVHASQGVIAVFLYKVLRREVINIWGDGSVTRDYIYISDVINALLAAHLYEGKERIFNIGSGKGHNLNQVLDSIECVTGLTANRRYLPGRTLDVPANVLSIHKAKEFLQWQPEVNFEEGLSRFAKWLQRNPPDP